MNFIEEKLDSGVLGPDRGPWLQTYTGHKFYLFDPQPDDIHLEDVVQALSRQCRYAGHCRIFYSVLEHSLHVSNFLPPCLQKWGLLHDAAEAYLPDLPSPWKRHEAFSFYREAEDLIMKTVAVKFGLDWPMPELVKQADEFLLFYEAKALLPDTEWSKPYEKKFTGWHLGEKTQEYPDSLAFGSSEHVLRSIFRERMALAK